MRVCVAHSAMNDYFYRPVRRGTEKGSSLLSPVKEAEYCSDTDKIEQRSYKLYKISIV